MAFLKPSFSTVTEYVPTKRFGNTYVPSLEAVVDVSTPVAKLVAVTLASWIVPWLLSQTVMRSVPSNRCAWAALPSKIQTNADSAVRVSLRIAFSPSRCLRASKRLKLALTMSGLNLRYVHKLVVIGQGI